MHALLDAFSADADFQSVAAGVRSGMREQIVSGLTGSSRQVMIAALEKELGRPFLIVTHNMFAAQKIHEDLVECLSEDRVLLYPSQELIAAEAAAASPEMLASRIDVLTKLAQGFTGIVITPFAGLRRLLPDRDVFADCRLQVKAGDELNLNEFLERMTELGYERVEQVERKGEMSVRGGIIDFFPLTFPLAVRIELFDVEVESIRTFDVTDQRSVDKMNAVTIPPCREILIDRKRFQNAAQHAYELLEAQLAKMTDRTAKEKLLEGIGHDIERLREGQHFPGIFKYMSLLYPQRQTLLDYVAKDTVLLIDEPARLLETARQLERDDAEWMTHSLQEGGSMPALVLSKTYESLLQRRPFPTLFLSLFLRQVPGAQPQNIVNFMCRAMQSFHGQMNVLKSEMERWKKSGAKVLVLAGGEERADRVRRVLADYHIAEPTILNGSLQSGFELPSVHLVVITEGEIFTQKQRKARKVDKKIENAERIKSYQELKVGDYVVHVNHGIGKYVGIGTLEVGGIHKDYLHILYAGGDKLSVPIEQIDLIQKYVGSDDKEPKVYKLGGATGTASKTKRAPRSKISPTI
ncbi:CarD family transcriptional regulator [Gordoniibacillus kamchatkensis]|uniref:CarD family transcriptional regulator n=1 Tax=Gordoniibacillus kamchatkensis TaxID=1590651 RepID=UPI00373AF46D